MIEQVKQKIQTPDELSHTIARLKEEGKTVVHCHGVFDLVHPGHLFHFEAAKKNGDILVVSVTADKFVNKGPGRPIFPAEVRAKSLASLHIIDYVTINNNPNAVDLLKNVKPHIYFKGSEYEVALNDPSRTLYQEAEAVRSVGGDIKFSYEPTYSSTNFLRNLFDLYPENVKDFLKNFSERYTVGKIIETLDKLRDMKILVIGETIIDEYHYCRGMGKIPKDNLIATKYLNDETFAGGVLACANHLAGFCNNVHLVTALGRGTTGGAGRDYEDFIKSKLKSGIAYKFFYDDDGQTVVKRRFIDPTFFVKMFEVYYFDDRHLPVNISRQISGYLDENLSQYDVVIVTDYGHGFFDQNIINTLTNKAKFLAVNTQTNSANAGFNLITKYPRADYVCIDEPEARLAVHKKEADILEVANNIFRAVDIKKMMITRGHLGSMAYDGESKIYSSPVFSTKIVDRVGAGDAFLAITSPCVASGAPMDIVSFIGNVVGAIHVTVVGNKSSVEPDPVHKFIHTLFK